MSQEQKIGRYIVQATLGEGAMGCVYRALDPYIKRTVAIKTIKLEQSRNEEETKEFFQRFFQEAQISGLLNHPNIVAIYDVGEQEGMPWIAMEYVEGKTLKQWSASKPKPSVDAQLRIVIQIAKALEFAHSKGIVHRDLKPGNIMVTPNGTGKIMDFGIAKMSGSDLTQTGVFLGTPSYSSPEQVRESKIDHRSDIFSFGILAHETISGHSPFPGNSISGILYKIANERPSPVPNIRDLPINPETWKVVFDKVLAKNPEERYQNAAEFAYALVEAVQLDDKEQATIRRLVEDLDATMVAGGNPMVSTHFQAPPAETEIQRSDFEKSLSGRPLTAEKPRSKGSLFFFLAILLIGLGGGYWALGPGGMLNKGGKGGPQGHDPNASGNASGSPDSPAGPNGGTSSSDGEASVPTLFAKSVRIETEPAGAEVMIGGDSVGRTPMTYNFTGETGQVRSLSLHLKGYRDLAQSLVLGTELKDKYVLSLEPELVAHQVVAEPAGAEILVDGVSVGTAPLEFQFQSGRSYKIEARAPGYFDKTLTYREGKSEPDSLNLSLKREPPPGSLKFDTELRDLKVEINGKSYKAERISLRPGLYEVDLMAPSAFYRERKTVEIASGELAVMATPIVIKIPKIDFVQGYAHVKIDGIYVKNGDKLDTTPLVDIPITLGMHKFEITDGDGKILAQKSIKVERSEDIIISPGN